MLRVCAVLSMAFVSLSALAGAPFEFADTPGQLPKTIVPLHYELHIDPDLQALRFSGSETVTIEVRQATPRIVLNALDLDVGRASLRSGGGAARALAPIVDPERQTLRFELGEPLEPGEYELRIEYSGRIGPQAQGLYYDRYPTHGGEEKVLLATQMEPTDARRLLPCWDEPAFRASFRMSVDLPQSFSAYSNMPVTRTAPLKDGRKRVSFERTPKMPSYLIVLVAGVLETVADTQDGTRLGIVATEGKQGAARYALRSSAKLLRYYNEYFDTAYPLPKLDQIAVPGGFNGAMENWGGIVYNETLLLYDPGTSSPETRKAVFDVVAHEMAHQWFGDLVTMAWWDDLWLNEGFASWMATKATDHFNPGWKRWLHADGERERAMVQDARATTHPIQQPVHNENEAMDAFDDITYLKGQSFLRMLETYLGEDAFRAGLRAYMKAHAYSNATTADLWAALEDASGKPVRDLARGWTEQPGFPLVSVDAQCRGGKREVRLSQRHYRSDGEADADRLWTVPVALAILGGPQRYVRLDTAEQRFELETCDGPLLVDPQAVGYFRVRYAPDMLQTLSTHLPELPAPARLKLLGDVWALSQSGELPLRAYFDVLTALGDEPEDAIWSALLRQLRTLQQLSEGEEVAGAFRAFEIRYLAPKLEALGWSVSSQESIDRQSLRAELIEHLAEAGDAQVLAEARRRFERFVEAPASLPPSLRAAVLDVMGMQADGKVFQQLLDGARKALTTEEKLRYVDALIEVRDPELIRKTLALTLSDELPPILAIRIPLKVALAGPNRDLAWDYAREHVAPILSRLADFQRNAYFGGIASASYDPRRADELEAFAKAHLPAGAYPETHDAAAQIRVKAATRARLLPQLEALLRN